MRKLEFNHWTREVPAVNYLLMNLDNVYIDGTYEVRHTEIPGIASALCTILDRDLPEYMEEYGEALREMAEETDEDYMNIDNFDYELNLLYDYADTCRIWFGNGVV